MRPALVRRAGATASAAVVLALSASAMAAPASSWRTVDMTARQGEFFSVAAADQRHAWAVGVSPTRNGDFAPLIGRWNGVSWAPVALPAKVRSRLGTLALETAVASGPRSLWAFSVVGSWLHYDGSSWITGIVPDALITTASAVAARKYIWAFGLGDTFGRPVPFSAYAADINGRVRWVNKAVPGGAVIYGASAVSGSDLWAVGISGLIASGIGARSSAIAARDMIAGGGISTPDGIASTVTLRSGLLHYYAGRWHKAVPLPAAMRKLPATRIFARSDTSVWVGGAVRNAAGGTTEAIAHWTGRGWALVKLPARASKGDYRTEAISTDGSGGLWALATCGGPGCAGGGLTSRLWHEQAGRWTGPIQPALARHPTVLVDLAEAGRSVWAAGAVMLAKNDIRGLIAVWSAASTSRPK